MNEHVTTEIAREILLDFYARGMKQPDLIEKYNLTKARRNSPVTWLPDPLMPGCCSECEGGLRGEWEKPHKSESYEPKIINARCLMCDHLQEGDCDCEFCLQMKDIQSEADKKEKQRRIDIKLDNLSSPIFAESVEFTLLKAYAEQSTHEDLTYISPTSYSHEEFSPNPSRHRDYRQSLMSFMFPFFPLDAFDLLEDGRLAWDGERCYHKIKTQKDFNNPAMALQILTFGAEEFNDFLLKIMVDECTNYLSLQKSRYRYDTEYGEKTEKVFEELLQKYTIAQIFSIIWTGCKNAANFRAQGPISFESAGKSCITFAKNYADRAEEKGWTINPYFRGEGKSQSVLCRVIMRDMLRKNDDIINYSYQDLKLRVPTDEEINLYYEDKIKIEDLLQMEEINGAKTD